MGLVRHGDEHVQDLGPIVGRRTALVYACPTRQPPDAPHRLADIQLQRAAEVCAQDHPRYRRAPAGVGLRRLAELLAGAGKTARLV